MNQEPEMYFNEHDIEILGKLDEMPLMDALRYIGCDPREIKTPHGTLIILQDR